MAFSHESHWWQCLECKAEWREKVVNVTKRNNVCKHCSKQSASTEYNLLKSYPKIAKELINADPTKIIFMLENYINGSVSIFLMSGKVELMVGQVRGKR